MVEVVAEPSSMSWSRILFGVFFLIFNLQSKANQLKAVNFLSNAAIFISGALVKLFQGCHGLWQKKNSGEVRESALSSGAETAATTTVSSSNASGSSSSTSISRRHRAPSVAPNPFLPVKRRPLRFVGKDSSRWQADADAACCHNNKCNQVFTLLKRRHHCRLCGFVYCMECSAKSIVHDGQKHRVCRRCYKRWHSVKTKPFLSKRELDQRHTDAVPGFITILNGNYDLELDQSDDISPLLKFYDLPGFIVKAASMLTYKTTLTATAKMFECTTESRFKTVKEHYDMDYLWKPFNSAQGIKQARARVVGRKVVTHVLYKPGYVIVAQRGVRVQGQVELLVNEIKVMESDAKATDALLAKSQQAVITTANPAADTPEEQYEQALIDLWIDDIPGKPILTFTRVFSKHPAKPSI